ncbi:hypothetical protein ACF1BS_21550 [Streptomyces sp. NPDC014748]|uniref:hypothetical protein n=1 Tax=Streptomyces sp. NPDC014748 TaxID=3364905 RepID=UPI0036FD39F0
MVDGFIRWYRESGKISTFSNQLSAFKQHGVTITHPETGVATVINVDGDDVTIDLEELSRLIGLRIPSVTVNWWVTDGANVVGEYSQEPLGCEIQTFWLDGVDSEEADVVRSAVMSAIIQASTPTRALVCDTQGVTDAHDWDSVILYGETELPGIVDCLLVGPEVTSRVLSVSGNLRSESMGDNTNLVRVIAT